jgi:hypothetical protein
MKEQIHSMRNWVMRYERHLSSLSLMVGFIVDAFTLRRVDMPLENIVIVAYLMLVGVGIALLNVLEMKHDRSSIESNVYRALPFVIQFALGALFSSFTVFYSRSGSYTASWPFILILFGLLIGNEVIKKHYERFIFQITVYFTALFFFAIFAVPVYVRSMGAFIFIASGIFSLALISLFIYILRRFARERVEENKKYFTYSIAVVFALINFLYFTNIIPPIPLSLKSGGIYHNLIRMNNSYIAFDEKRTGLENWQVFEDVHITRGEPLFAYSAVFAPADIKTEIVHNWQYFDESIGRWVSETRIPFTITGGSDRGYRGHSVKEHLREGEWRVDVETSRGQVIGRITFEVVYTSVKPELVEKNL